MRDLLLRWIELGMRGETSGSESLLNNAWDRRAHLDNNAVSLHVSLTAPPSSSASWEPIDFTISEPGWEPIIGTFKEAGEDNYVSVLFAAVTQVASAACHDTKWLPVGETAVEIATGLADIAEFTTREPLTEVTAFGYDGYHLVLEVPEGDHYQSGQGFTGCDDPNNPSGHSFDGWEGPTFSRYYQRPGQIIEYWVLAVEGTPLLIESNQFPDSPQSDIAELQDVLDSIVITP